MNAYPRSLIPQLGHSVAPPPLATGPANYEARWAPQRTSFGRRFAALAAATIVLCGGVVRAQDQAASADDLAKLKKLSLTELMDVEVTSVSRRPEPLANAASAIQVISNEDIARSGATRLPEALRLATNLEVAQIDSRQWAISARGYNNTVANKMLVLMDGRILYTPLYAGVFWDVQDTMLQDLDRIEVISGPGATQWGANAVNGVINIISKSAKDTQGELAYGGVGNELQSFGGVRYGGEAGDGIYYRVYAKYSSRDNSVGPGGASGNDAWRFGQGGLRVDWAGQADDQFTVESDGYSGHIAQPKYADISVSGGNVNGRWTRTLGDASDLRLQTYYDYTHRRIPGTFAEDLGTYVVDFQHRFPIGQINDVVWGLNYRLIQDRVTNSAALAFLPPKVSQYWYSGFLQDEIAVTQRFHVTGGIKAERNPYTGTEYQPAVRVAWRATHEQTLWAAVSRAIRTPSRIDRDFYVPSTPPYLLEGGPSFRSEKLLSYELGYRVQPRADVAVSLSGFYNDYDDLRSVEPLNPPAQFPAVLANGLEGQTHGVELAADYRVTDRWRLHLGYTELRARSAPKSGSLDQISARSTALDPNHQAQLRSFFDLGAGVQFDGTLRYVGPIAAQMVPGYAELDLHFGWRFRPEWEVALVGQNLLHARHAEFGAPATRHEIGRGVYLQFTWKR